MKKTWVFVPFILFIGLMVFLGRGLFLDPQHLPSTRIGKALPSFSLPVLTNENRVFTPDMMKGNIGLLTIWASWCHACEEEQAFLMQLHAQGIPLFAINYKDKPSEALQWLKTWGNPYQCIGEDKEGKIAIDLGVYGAPETFLIDDKGLIHFRHVGVLDENVWQRDFVPRIRQLRANG